MMSTIPLTFLYAEDGVAWFESDDGEHSIDVPMTYLTEGSDGLMHDFIVTETSEAYISYEEDDSVSFIARNDDKVLYLSTIKTPTGFELKSVYILLVVTKQ